MTNPASGVETPQNTPGSAPAPGTGTPSPQAQGGAAGTPPDKGQGKQVPIPVLHEERDKRQAAEARSQALEEEIENLKQLLGQYSAPQAPPYQPYQQPQYQPYQQPYQQPQQQPYGQPPYGTPPQPVKEQIDALWQEDIRKGFQAEMMAMMQYRDWVDAKVDNEFEQSRVRHKDDFNNYEGKIRSYIRTLPMDARSQPNIVEAAYLMVKGSDADNIIKQREAQIMQKYQGQQAGAGIAGTFGTPGQPVGSPTLTPEEMQAAQAMKLSPEEYLKWRG
jgi:hypothetical protein